MAKRLGIAILILSGLIIGSTLYDSISAYYAKYDERNCREVNIDFNKTSTDDPLLDKGEKKVTTAGVNGIETICTDGFHNVKSDEITRDPVDEITSIGTREPEPEYPVYYDESEYPYYGSICNDGWHSPSVGRGACSWHGGVAY